MKEKRKRLEELTGLLGKATKVYYQGNNEIMSNREYDELYDELMQLENELGIVLSGSPTAKVGYQVADTLEKQRHPSPMLSLDKTKDVEALKDWLGDREGLLSWKLDGLTIVLTYEGGHLNNGVTRGDGTVGEVITGNAKVFDNIPLSIPSQGRVVIRGEAVISYPDFEVINRSLDHGDAVYKNPRNLCSGTVRQLNSRITADRHVKFFAFSLAEAPREFTYRHEQMEWMAHQGFETVEYLFVKKDTLAHRVRSFEKKIVNFSLPSDGLVLIFDDIEYGNSLGATAKFPRDSIAFKWKDEVRNTHLIEILWNVSRTGLINPIAVFEPVELEGTTVSRASVHNLSILRELALGAGDEISVYKANMIIPQIGENLTRSGGIVPPDRCPVCGSITEIKNNNGAETVHCPNPICPAKRIKSFTHFVGRNALNIEGLSEATLEKFVDEAMVREFVDIFKLDRWRDRIINMEGFGEKSFENLISSVKKAAHTTPVRLLYGLGIPNIGVANAKMIAKVCRNKWEKMQSLTESELTDIGGIGNIMARAYVDYFQSEKNKKAVDDLLPVLSLDETFEESARSLEGKTFVITGAVNHFENRDRAKKAIEDAGGKTSSAVSSKTDFLVNNDINSGSSKNKRAKELGVLIITEDELLKMLNY